VDSPGKSRSTLLLGVKLPAKAAKNKKMSGNPTAHSVAGQSESGTERDSK